MGINAKSQDPRSMESRLTYIEKIVRQHLGVQQGIPTSSVPHKNFGVATDHGTLVGLSDDDHPQYLLLADIDDTPVNGVTTAPISSNWAYDHAANASAHGAYLLIADIDDTPVNGETSAPISSNWAYDHIAASDPHTGYRLESADHNHQSTGAQAGQLDHGAALTGLTDDDHTQYALLAGRSGGQTLIGGTGASESLILNSTSNATKGRVRGTKWGIGESVGNMSLGQNNPAAHICLLLTNSITDDGTFGFSLYTSSITFTPSGNNKGYFGFYAGGGTMALGTTTGLSYYGAYIEGPSKTGTGTAATGIGLKIIKPTIATSNYYLDFDSADATDPTGGGGAATGRIPIIVGGVARYLAYY